MHHDFVLLNIEDYFMAKFYFYLIFEDQDVQIRNPCAFNLIRNNDFTEKKILLIPVPVPEQVSV